MQPLKVLQIFTILNRGGAETNLMNYYRKIDKNKILFDFVVHRKEEGEYEKEIITLGGKIFHLPSLHPRNINEYKFAVRNFFDENPGYQIIHGQCSELGVFIYEEAKKRKIPVIIAHAHSSKMSFDAKAIFRLKWKLTMRKYINAYFTCGVAASKYLFGYKLACKTFQVNNAVDANSLMFNENVRKVVQYELDAVETFNVVHVGSFNKIKNHRFIIKIFGEIVKIIPNSKLFLVGEGVLKVEIMTLVSKLDLKSHVFFLGTRSDVSKLLQAMDLFLFPSLYEGLPLSLIEAQTSGIFCAISNTIPAEAVLIPDNVKIYDLNHSAKFWAEEIIRESASFKRKDVTQVIKDAGYDINDNVAALEEKYFELYNQFS